MAELLPPKVYPSTLMQLFANTADLDQSDLGLKCFAIFLKI